VKTLGVIFFEAFEIHQLVEDIQMLVLRQEHLMVMGAVHVDQNGRPGPQLSQVTFNPFI